MPYSTSRLSLFFFSLATVSLLAAPALALDFAVHGYDLGERIELTSGRRVWTAEFDVSLDTVADHVNSFCVDLDTYINIAEYEARDVLEASSTASPSDETPRDFAWAGHVMDGYGSNLDRLVTADVSRDQAITGVQAAIWEGLYGGGVVLASSLSEGARTVYDRIMAGPGTVRGVGGRSLVVDLVGAQDQIISNPVPEPSAALVFGLGSVLVGHVIRRRSPRA